MLRTLVMEKINTSYRKSSADGIFSLEFKKANKSQRLIGTEKDSKLVNKKSR